MLMAMSIDIATSMSIACKAARTSSKIRAVQPELDRGS
jgi:hypothetical protein